MLYHIPINIPIPTRTRITPTTRKIQFNTIQPAALAVESVIWNTFPKTIATSPIIIRTTPIFQPSKLTLLKRYKIYIRHVPYR